MTINCDYSDFATKLLELLPLLVGHKVDYLFLDINNCVLALSCPMFCINQVNSSNLRIFCACSLQACM